MPGVCRELRDATSDELIFLDVQRAQNKHIHESESVFYFKNHGTSR